MCAFDRMISGRVRSSCAQQTPITQNPHRSHKQLATMIHNEHKMALLRSMGKSQEQFKFWSTQPVLRLGALMGVTGVRTQIHGRGCTHKR